MKIRCRHEWRLAEAAIRYDHVVSENSIPQYIEEKTEKILVLICLSCRKVKSL